MTEANPSRQSPRPSMSPSNTTTTFEGTVVPGSVTPRSKELYGTPTTGLSPALTEKELEAHRLDVDEWAADPANGRNWSQARKWTATAIVSLYTFIPPLASSMMAPGLSQVAIKYGITNEALLSLTLSIFLLSFAIAPLIMAPLSEIYGRNRILHAANLTSMVFSLGCAFAPNTGAFIALRFLAGISGSAPVAIGPGTVGDLFSERDRGSALAVYSLGPLLGPAVGPVAGGFIAQYADIKFVFVAIAALCGAASLIGIPFLQETYAPVIQYRMAKKAGDTEKMARLRQEQTKGVTKAQFVWVNIKRPFIYTTRSLICFLFGLYMAVLYGCYYIMFATFAKFFRDTYGFEAGVGGLTYLGLGIGLFGATAFSGTVADRSYRWFSERNGGVGKPEFRIPALGPGVILAPIGLFWYGWSAAAPLHWIMPIIGTGIFGFGFMSIYVPMQLYLVDSFQYAASVSAATAVFRSFLGFVFPLFGQDMNDALGIGPANSLLGAVAIVLGIPFPLFIYFKGEKMRARNKYTAHSVKQSPEKH